MRYVTAAASQQQRGKGGERVGEGPEGGGGRRECGGGGLPFEGYLNHLQAKCTLYYCVLKCIYHSNM